MLYPFCKVNVFLPTIGHSCTVFSPLQAIRCLILCRSNGVKKLSHRSRQFSFPLWCGTQSRFRGNHERTLSKRPGRSRTSGFTAISPPSEPQIRTPLLFRPRCCEQRSAQYSRNLQADLLRSFHPSGHMGTDQNWWERRRLILETAPVSDSLPFNGGCHDQSTIPRHFQTHEHPQLIWEDEGP